MCLVDAQDPSRISCRVPLADARSGPGVTTSEREELVRLRRENRQSKLAREIPARDGLAVFSDIEGYYNPLRRHSAAAHPSSTSR